MLAAVLHGKAARVEVDGKDVSWRELFRQREDLITAAFFGRFLYLSPTMRQKALAMMIGRPQALEIGDIEEVLFWPSFKLNKVEGEARVQPDVLIRCKKGLVMVEVKPPWGYQCEGQWLKEVVALKESTRSKVTDYVENINTVHFVALGQNLGLDIKKTFDNFDTEDIFDFEAHQKEWNDILLDLDSWADLEEVNDRAIVADWGAIFELFGVRRPIKPLKDLLGMPRIDEESLSLLNKMQIIPDKPEQPQLFWLALLSLSNEFYLEDSQCQSLLKKLAF